MLSDLQRERIVLHGKPDILAISLYDQPASRILRKSPGVTRILLCHPYRQRIDRDLQVRQCAIVTYNVVELMIGNAQLRNMDVKLRLYCFLSRRASDLDHYAAECTNPFNFIVKAQIGDRTYVSNVANLIAIPNGLNGEAAPPARLIRPVRAEREKLIEPVIV